MNKIYYETIFMCTETLQNGKERRIKKSVFAEMFIDGKNNGIEQRILKGTKALESLHYYKIEYIDTKKTTFIFE